MSRATTTTTTTARAAEKPPAIVQHFHGGPFDGRSYAGEIPGVPPSASPGAVCLTIPYGLSLEGCFCWYQHTLRWESDPSPSDPNRFVRYRNGDPGEWHYVPHTEG